MLIALIAAGEAMLYSASWFKRERARKQQLLMGTIKDLVQVMPFADDYLKRKTKGASNLQRFIASKLAQICRRLTNSRSFEYALLLALRKAIMQRNKVFNRKERGLQ
jgi:hypothetical protein